MVLVEQGLGKLSDLVLNLKKKRRKKQELCLPKMEFLCWCYNPNYFFFLGAGGLRGPFPNCHSFFNPTIFPTLSLKERLETSPNLAHGIGFLTLPLWIYTWKSGELLVLLWLATGTNTVLPGHRCKTYAWDFPIQSLPHLFWIDYTYN